MFAHFDRRGSQTKRNQEERKRRAKEEHEREVGRKVRQVLGLPDKPDDEVKKPLEPPKNVKKQDRFFEDPRKKKITWRRIKVLFKCFFKL
jgi:hypothetical protein